MSPDAVVRDLEARNIESRHLWKPMHLQPVHASCRAFVTGESEHLFRSGLALPSGSALSDSDVGRVVAALLESVQARRVEAVAARA